MRKPTNLQVARFAAGMTTRDLAAKMGVSHTTVQHWDHGRYVPSDKDMERLRKILPELRLPCGNRADSVRIRRDGAA